MNAKTINNIEVNTDIGRGAIFYDDDCGFCTGLARRLPVPWFTKTHATRPPASRTPGCSSSGLSSELS